MRLDKNTTSDRLRSQEKCTVRSVVAARPWLRPRGGILVNKVWSMTLSASLRTLVMCFLDYLPKIS